MTNGGTLIVGDAGRMDRLAIAGHFEQSGAGVILADINPTAGKGDMLAVAGDVRLDGAVRVSPRTLTAGAEHRILEVEGAMTGRFDSVRSNLFAFAQTADEDGLILRADSARRKPRPPAAWRTCSRPGTPPSRGSSARWTKRREPASWGRC